MPRRRIILIPPSEGKAVGGEGPPWSEAPGAQEHPLYRHRAQVIEALRSRVSAKSFRRPAASKLLGVSGEALDRALDADRELDGAPTLRAIERYEQGVLYQYLAAESFDARTTSRMVRSVRILSGLWGVLRPDEMIPDYRLKMGASLPGIGKLSTWWRQPVSDLLEHEIRTAELWNLLPLEHGAAFVVPAGVTQVSVVFLQPGRGGDLIAVSHWNKALKGALVAHLLHNPSLAMEDLAGWEHPAGYVLDPASLVASEGTYQLRFVAGGGSPTVGGLS